MHEVCRPRATCSGNDLSADRDNDGDDDVHEPDTPRILVGRVAVSRALKLNPTGSHSVSRLNLGRGR